jgi:predicted 3-demethylubiquinone-9 3-methyltransferase (glyoxalase superfamily)
MQKITPFLWFSGNAKEASNFYISRFKNKNQNLTHHGVACGKVFGKPKGSLMAISFQLCGQPYSH